VRQPPVFDALFRDGILGRETGTRTPATDELDDLGPLWLVSATEAGRDLAAGRSIGDTGAIAGSLGCEVVPRDSVVEGGACAVEAAGGGEVLGDVLSNEGEGEGKAEEEDVKGEEEGSSFLDVLVWAHSFSPFS
jgi:hypothetical protein